jgi:hypothetical protein
MRLDRYLTAALFSGTQPAEKKWNILQHAYFTNRVFDVINASTKQTEFSIVEIRQQHGSDQMALISCHLENVMGL